MYGLTSPSPCIDLPLQKTGIAAAPRLPPGDKQPPGDVLHGTAAGCEEQDGKDDADGFLLALEPAHRPIRVFHCPPLGFHDNLLSVLMDTTGIAPRDQSTVRNTMVNHS